MKYLIVINFSKWKDLYFESSEVKHLIDKICDKAYCQI